MKVVFTRQKTSVAFGELASGEVFRTTRDQWYRMKIRNINPSYNNITLADGDLGFLCLNELVERFDAHIVIEE